MTESTNSLLCLSATFGILWLAAAQAADTPPKPAATPRAIVLPDSCNTPDAMAVLRERGDHPVGAELYRPHVARRADEDHARRPGFAVLQTAAASADRPRVSDGRPRGAVGGPVRGRLPGPGRDARQLAVAVRPGHRRQAGLGRGVGGGPECRQRRGDSRRLRVRHRFGDGQDRRRGGGQCRLSVPSRRARRAGQARTAAIPTWSPPSRPSARTFPSAPTGSISTNRAICTWPTAAMRSSRSSS